MGLAPVPAAVLDDLGSDEAGEQDEAEEETFDSLAVHVVSSLLVSG